MDMTNRCSQKKVQDTKQKWPPFWTAIFDNVNILIILLPQFLLPLFLLLSEAC
jgi:hypothetical protein